MFRLVHTTTNVRMHICYHHHRCRCRRRRRRRPCHINITISSSYRVDVRMELERSSPHSTHIASDSTAFVPAVVLVHICRRCSESYACVIVCVSVCMGNDTFRMHYILFGATERAPNALVISVLIGAHYDPTLSASLSSRHHHRHHRRHHRQSSSSRARARIA